MSEVGVRLVREVLEKMREAEGVLVMVGRELMGVRSMDKEDIFYSSVLHEGAEFMRKKLDEMPHKESDR